MHKLLYFPIGNYYNYNIETYFEIYYSRDNFIMSVIKGLQKHKQINSFIYIYSMYLLV